MAGIIYSEALRRAALDVSKRPLDLNWGNWKREAIRDYGKASTEYIRRGGWWNKTKGLAAAFAESAADLAPDTWKGVAFDVGTLGLGSATKLTKLSKLAKIAGPLEELSKGEKGTEAVIDLFKSVGYREGAQRLSRVLLARRGLEPTVKAIEQATKGIDAWHLGEKAMKPLHEMGGSHAHHTQSTISAGIKKAGGTPISRTRLQLSEPKLHIPTPHRPTLGNFHLRAPSIVQTKPTISSGIKKAVGTPISTTRLQLSKPTLRIPTPHRPSLGNFHLRAPSIVRTQPTISSGIKKAGGTPISTTRLQLRKPTLRIPTAHRPSLGNFHLRAPHRTFAPPRHVVRSAIRPAFRR